MTSLIALDDNEKIGSRKSLIANQETVEGYKTLSETYGTDGYELSNMSLPISNDNVQHTKFTDDDSVTVAFPSNEPGSVHTFSCFKGLIPKDEIIGLVSCKGLAILPLFTQ